MLVTGDLRIEPQVRLTIRPGVQVLFDGFHELAVQGTLEAVGTPGAFIRLASRHPEAFAVDSTTTGAWRGLRFIATSSSQPPSRLAWCRIENCKAAGDGRRGAALAIDRFSKIELVDCIFTDNVADYGAVLYAANHAAPVLVGCVLAGNHAFLGGSVVFAQDAFPRLIHCTIAANPVHNPGIFVGTAAIHNHISKTRTLGSIVWENPSQYFLGGQIYEGKAFYTTWCDVSGGHPGVGNFSAEPAFLDGGAHPFALLEDSPCIDAGPPDLAGLPLPEVDPSGAPRTSQGRIDVGAYEWQPASAAPEPMPAVPPTPAAQLWLTGPQPARDRVGLRFRLEHPAQVRLTTCDATGRLIRRLLAAPAAAGEQAVVWDGLDDHGHPVPSGIYLVRLEVDGRLAAGARLAWVR